MGISPTQLLIILLIIILIFGTKKLRNIGGDLGAAVKNFKKGMEDESAKSEPAVQNEIVGELIEQKVEEKKTVVEEPTRKSS